MDRQIVLDRIIEMLQKEIQRSKKEQISINVSKAKFSDKEERKLKEQLSNEKIRVLSLDSHKLVIRNPKFTFKDNSGRRPSAIYDFLPSGYFPGGRIPFK